MNENAGARSLACGAVAGLAVDFTLYPLDTMKTRLQSSQGFRAAGEFRSLYSGMGSVAVGSAPGAALFFLSYNKMKTILGKDSSLSHAASASVGEVIACLVRVPSELVKQRAQANSSLRLSNICREIFRSDGLFGFFRGYGTTIAREIPFALIEFPLWEALKSSAARYQHQDSVSPLVGASCGSVAGAVAAALTTPLDVAKTRVMLGHNRKHGIVCTLGQIYKEGGVARLFSGVVPRTLWMTLGGFIFFGAYGSAVKLSHELFP